MVLHIHCISQQIGKHLVNLGPCRFVSDALKHRSGNLRGRLDASFLGHFPDGLIYERPESILKGSGKLYWR